MPLHDWTRVPAGLFHDFHQSWSMFVGRGWNVKVPLEPTYIATWNVSLAELREAVETGRLPEIEPS